MRPNRLCLTVFALACASFLIVSLAHAAGQTDLANATVVVRPGKLPNAEKTAARVLTEEVTKRTGLVWPVTTKAPASGTVIELSGKGDPKDAALKAEGFRVSVDNTDAKRPVVRIQGADARGALFGVGWLLRQMDWGTGKAKVASDLAITTSPVDPLRGHQLGYRATANSWDAWNVAQYEQYIRDLVIFGDNAIETIPFQDDASPVMPIPREEMDMAVSRLCDDYGIEFWIWAPADFDLKDTAKRAEALDQWEAFFKKCTRLDGLFFPGGDPGDNPPELVMPFLEDVSKRLAKHKPQAGIWISLQGFDKPAVDRFYEYVNKNQPKWMTGAVWGPQSPPAIETRQRLPKQYKLRLYPDVTHNIICQFAIPWMDPAWALTLGREPVNPRPQMHAYLHNFFAPQSDGFLTYSDGIHDDVNKNIWSAMGWDPKQDVRDVLVEYARCFFRPDLAERAADGLLAFETNLAGPLAQNGAVEGNYDLWSGLDASAPDLRGNWRWRMYQFRAAYDAYTHRRLLRETRLEQEVNAALDTADKIGADAAMKQALDIYRRVETAPTEPALRAKIEQDAADLFRIIGYQTSVPKYHAKNPERGAMLDWVDRPLNNRWWLEDEFPRVAKMGTEQEKVARLKLIADWENPGPGGFYDDVGNVAKSPHVLRGGWLNEDPEMTETPLPGYATWKGLKSTWRLSWMTNIDWPVMQYEGLDPKGAYTVRMTGMGEALLRINGELVKPTVYSKELGQFKEFPVPPEALKNGKIKLTWDKPDEEKLNWRERSNLNEIWVIKK